MKRYSKYKTVVLLLLSFFMMGIIHGQAHIGIRGGVTITNQEFKSGNLDVEPKSKFGADVALVTEFTFLGISLAPELHWIQKGYKIDDIQGTPGEITSTFNYLELPILVKFNFGVDAAKFFLMAGPSFGYLLDRKTTDEEGNTVNVFGNENFKAEVGGQLGAGVGLGPVRVDARYFLGFTNIAKNYPFVDEVKNKGFGAGVSLMF